MGFRSQTVFCFHNFLHILEAGVTTFEIPPALAILTSGILGSGSNTTLVEKVASSCCAATSVTQPGPHPSGGRRPIFGEGK